MSPDCGKRKRPDKLTRPDKKIRPDKLIRPEKDKAGKKIRPDKLIRPDKSISPGKMIKKQMRKRQTFGKEMSDAGRLSLLRDILCIPDRRVFPPGEP